MSAEIIKMLSAEDSKTADALTAETDADAALIQDEQVAEAMEPLELVEADMKLRNGVLTIRQKRKRTKKPGSPEAKSAAQRQAEFKARKQEAGFERDWLHASLKDLAEARGDAHEGQIELAREFIDQGELIEKTRAELSDLMQQREALKAQLEDITTERDSLSAEYIEIKQKIQRIPRFLRRFFF